MFAVERELAPELKIARAGRFRNVHTDINMHLQYESWRRARAYYLLSPVRSCVIITRTIVSRVCVVSLQSRMQRAFRRRHRQTRPHTTRPPLIRLAKYVYGCSLSPFWVH